MASARRRSRSDTLPGDGERGLKLAEEGDLLGEGADTLPGDGERGLKL